MSAALLSPTAPQANVTPMLNNETCGVNIRGVPRAVWRRARQNALLSGIPFKIYVIKLLESSQPFPPSPAPSGTK